MDRHWIGGSVSGGKSRGAIGNLQIAVSAFLLLSSLVCALPDADCHAALWLYCIGASPEHSSKKYLKELSSTIDRGLTEETVVEGFERLVPDILAKLPPDFKFAVKGGMIHRRVFHWGLTMLSQDIGDAKTTVPLKKLLDLRVSRVDSLTPVEKAKLRKAYLQVISEEWSRRQADFVRKTKKIFGKDVAGKGNPVPSICVLLYEIHMIADCMDTRRTDLGDFDVHFREELIKHGLQAMTNSRKGRNLVRDLQRSYSRQPPIETKELRGMMTETPAGFQSLLYNRTTGSPEDEAVRRSMHLLLILREELPEVLRESYPRSMKPFSPVGR
jgi:hypothetical protein